MKLIGSYAYIGYESKELQPRTRTLHPGNTKGSDFTSKREWNIYICASVRWKSDTKAIDRNVFSIWVNFSTLRMIWGNGILSYQAVRMLTPHKTNHTYKIWCSNRYSSRQSQSYCHYILHVKNHIFPMIWRCRRRLKENTHIQIHIFFTLTECVLQNISLLTFIQNKK